MDNQPEDYSPNEAITKAVSDFNHSLKNRQTIWNAIRDDLLQELSPKEVNTIIHGIVEMVPIFIISEMAVMATLNEMLMVMAAECGKSHPHN